MKFPRPREARAGGNDALRKESTKIPDTKWYDFSGPEIPGWSGDVLTFSNPGGVLNMLSNDSLFDVISAQDAKDLGLDLTGAIGVTKKSGTMSGWDMPGPNGKYTNYDYGYFDHVYVSINSDSSEIAESSGKMGVIIREQSANYKLRTNYYLMIKLNSNNKL